MAITVTCPSCSTSFPVDPAKIPEGGVNARCSSCGDIFRIDEPAEADPLPTLEDVSPAQPATPAQPEAPAPAPPEPSAPATPLPATPAGGAPTAQPETPPMAETPPAPEEPAKAEPVGQAPSPSAPDEEPGGEAAGQPDSDPFAQPAPFEQTAPQEAPPPPIGDTLPAPEPDEPLPPAEPAEPLPAPESDDTTAAPSPQPPAAEAGEPEPAEAVAETSAPAVQGFTFGKRDPKDKAKRLARVLVSDMIMYNAERHQSALAQGTLQQDFEEEIEKSWKEYVEQVGEELASGEGRQYWTDALNDILAKGEKVF